MVGTCIAGGDRARTCVVILPCESCLIKKLVPNNSLARVPAIGKEMQLRPPPARRLSTAGGQDSLIGGPPILERSSAALNSFRIRFDGFCLKKRATHV